MPAKNKRGREEDDGQHVVVGTLVRRSAAACLTPAASFRRSLFTVSATRYCGIANGVRGAFGFVRGRVASQAANAGLNSGRKRRR